MQHVASLLERKTKMMMKFKLVIIVCYLGLQNHHVVAQTFKKKQLTYKRVKKSYEEKKKFLQKLLQDNNLKISSLELYIRLFKYEQEVEVWAKNKSEKTFKKIKTYPFCSYSGDLGPKRTEGDLQVPEGFYHIRDFNPWSTFYLSLGVNYPNDSDQKLGKKPLGGSIYIHGDCVTIGCVPITDDKIKELYLLAVEAKSRGQQKIPVDIFPFRMSKENMDSFTEQEDYQSHIVFWKSLQPRYQLFEKHKTLPSFGINSTGFYDVKK